MATAMDFCGPLLRGFSAAGIGAGHHGVAEDLAAEAGSAALAEARLAAEVPAAVGDPASAMVIRRCKDR